MVLFLPTTKSFSRLSQVSKHIIAGRNISPRRTIMTSTNPKAFRLSTSDTLFCLCDQQERFKDLIYNASQTLAAGTALIDMVHAAKIWNVPVLITEQYPKALKLTCDELAVRDGSGQTAHRNFKIVEKTIFSMLTPDTEDLFESEYGVNVNGKNGCKNVVLWGWEAHVCVQQTCLDLLNRDWNVVVVADGTSSQRKYDREIALDVMRGAGARVSTCESVLFEMMKGKEHEHFKSIQGLAIEYGKAVKEAEGSF